MDFAEFFNQTIQVLCVFYFVLTVFLCLLLYINQRMLRARLVKLEDEVSGLRLKYLEILKESVHLHDVAISVIDGQLIDRQRIDRIEEKLADKEEADSE